MAADLTEGSSSFVSSISWGKSVFLAMSSLCVCVCVCGVCVQM